MEKDTDLIIRKMSQQVKHYLITSIGKVIEEATDEELYRAISWVLREEVMINWTATTHTHMQKKCRKIYYLSMEWLPGRIFTNSIANIGAVEMVQRLVKHFGRDYLTIITSETDPGLGNGGLGRLAACFLDSLATQHYPAMGYGLRYQYGIFDQEIWSGVQIERPDCWLLNQFPWELRRDSHAAAVQFGGRIIADKNKHNEEIHTLVDYEEVRALPYDIPIVGYDPHTDYSALTLRLWTTKESPRNFLLARFNAGDLSDAAKNTALTDVLYPNDKFSLGLFMRIKQEYLLVSSALQDIFKQFHMTFGNDIEEFADNVRIQINDTHPALVVAEIMRMLTHHHEHPWEKAWDITKTVCSYTNHTVLKESLEEWDHELLKTLLPRQTHIIENINIRFCQRVRERFPNDEEKVRKMSIIEGGRVKMAHLAIVGAHKVNGVAKLHSEILKTDLFPEFNAMFPEIFMNVTNGVTQRRWLYKCNPLLAEFITSLIGDHWIKDFSHLMELHSFAKDPQVQEQIIKIKKMNKERFIRMMMQFKKERYGESVDLDRELFLDADALFDVQIKRIHEYKRQLMKALHAIHIFNNLQKNPDAHPIKRKIILGGKAAPGYDMAKNIIRLVYMLSRRINHDPVIGKKLKVVFVENYNVSKAEIIIPAAELSEQISTAGQEASGTSNMKLTINGALTIGTEDGANIEMREAVTDQWWPFRFGLNAREIDALRQKKTYNPTALISENASLRDVVERLQDDTFAENDIEKETLNEIYQSLVSGDQPDRYFVLQDFLDYLSTQEKVEQLYQKPHEWAEYAIHNIASMGLFSSDRSIDEYAKKIWNLRPCPVDKGELSRVREEFAKSDRCFIA